MNSKGKNKPLSEEEITKGLLENKKQVSSLNSSKSLYKKESGEYQEAKLKNLLKEQNDNLEKVMTSERISLDDVEEVKKRMLMYLRACEKTGSFPSKLGLARALGYSARALELRVQKKPKEETSKLIEMFNDLCAEIITQSALKNNANTIASIFIAKSMYGFKETNEVVLTPNSKNYEDDEKEYSIEEIRKRYIVEDTDTNKEDN